MSDSDFTTLIAGNGDAWLVKMAVGPLLDEQDQQHVVYVDRARRVVFVDRNASAADAAFAIAAMSNILHSRSHDRRRSNAPRLCFN